MAPIFCILGRLRPRSSSSPGCPQVMGPCFAGQTAQGLPAGEVSHCCFPRPLLIKPLLHLVFVRMSLNSGSQLEYLPFLLFPLS